MRLSIYDFSYESLEAREPVFSSVDKWDKPYRFRCSAVLLKIIDENRIRRRDALVTAYMHPESRIRFCEMNQMRCIQRIEMGQWIRWHFLDVFPMRRERIGTDCAPEATASEIITDSKDLLIGRRTEELEKWIAFYLNPIHTLNVPVILFRKHASIHKRMLMLRVIRAQLLLRNTYRIRHIAYYCYACKEYIPHVEYEKLHIRNVSTNIVLRSPLPFSRPAIW